MRHRLILSALIASALAFGTAQISAHAQATEGRASASTMSGDRSEPESALPKAEKEDPAEALKKPSSSVIKLGGMLGMSPETSVLAFQWVNFLILAAALLWALAKALPKAFRTRTEGIQKNIVQARVATEEAQTRLSAVEVRLQKLDGEIAALRAENDQAAAEEEARLHAHAEEEKKRILEAAEQEIAAASSAAQRSLQAYAAGIAVDRAAAQLNITPEDDRILIESFAGKLGVEGSRN